MYRGAINPERNGKTAVHWLVLAANQGYGDATTLLAECVGDKIGIFALN